MNLPIRTHFYVLGISIFLEICRCAYDRTPKAPLNNKRTDQDAEDCITRTNVAKQNGLPVPKVFCNDLCELLTVVDVGHSRFRLSVIEYINGRDYHRLGQKPTINELEYIVDIAYSLSKIDFHPSDIYDEWAIPHFCEEFIKNRRLLSDDQINLETPISAENG